MKTHWSIFLVPILFISCSPKFTEFNDSGFGNSMVTKSNLHDKIINLTSHEIKEENFQIIKDSIPQIIARKGNFGTKENINNQSKFFQYSPKKKLNIQSKVINSKSDKFKLPNKRSSFLHWEYLLASIAYFVYFATILYSGIGLFGVAMDFTDKFIAFWVVFFGLGGMLLSSAIFYISHLFDKMSIKICFTTKLGFALIPIYPLYALSLLLLIIGSIYDSVNHRKRRR